MISFFYFKNLSKKVSLIPFLSFTFLLTLNSSCISTKKVNYFSGLTDGTVNSSYLVPEPIIQKNDILNITIGSLNVEASQIFNPNTPNLGERDFNAPVSSVPVTGSSYLVENDGFVKLPIIGKLKAEGLSKSQFQDTLRLRIEQTKILKDPTVSIRFINFRVTVLGEVNRPGVVNVPNEKITFLEALGLAGDITVYGKKDEVTIIREEGTKKIIKKIDLNSQDLLSSQYYYLKANDVIIVEPTKAKIASASRTTQWLPVVLSGLSFVAIIADRLVR